MIYFNKTLFSKYYDVNELERILNKFTPDVVGRGKHKYLNLASAYDLEDTSFEDYELPLALMYHWQIGILDPVTKYIYCILGRTEEEELRAFDIISKYTYSVNKKAKFLLYVHNLSHEYYFLRGIIDIDDYFVSKEGRYLSVLYKNIEFKCSYQLSGVGLYSLHDYIINNKDVQKMVGSLDYSKVYTPISDLDDESIAYCMQDVRLVCRYIDEQIDKYGNIANIPNTKTSGVNRDMLAYCIPKGKDTMNTLQRDRYIREIAPLKFHHEAELSMAVHAFMGGHTTANPCKVGKIIKNVYCHDYRSDYTYCCCTCEFPNKYIDFYYNENEDFLKNEKNLNHAFICELEFTNIRPAEYGYVENKNKKIGAIFDYFIPSSKCVKGSLKNAILDNGKVVSADRLIIYCTNLDFDIYNDFYKWDNVKVIAITTYEKGYLPKRFIEYILYLFNNKQKFKGVAGKELDLALSKEALNSASYGTHVKSPLLETLQFDEDEETWRATIKGTWIEDAYNLDTNEGTTSYYLDKAKAYNRKLFSGQIVIPYVAAIFIPAIARRNISKAIFNAGFCSGKDIYDYSDTDSIYHEGEYAFIEDYNNTVKTNLYNMCNYYNLDFDLVQPGGKLLGVFAKENHYKYFKVLRAKTYICIDDNDELHVTIAGLNPVNGAIYLSKFDKTSEIYKDDKGKTHVIIHDYKPVFDAFKIGMKVPAGETGYLEHSHFKKEYKGTLIDYQGKPYKYDIKGGVNLRPSAFEIRENDDIEQLLDLISKVYYNVYYD